MLLPTWLRSTDCSRDNRRAKTRRSPRSPGAQRQAAARLSFEALEPRAMLATFAGLGWLAGGGVGSAADDISDNGLVVVGGSGGQAFRWEDGVMVGLGALPGGNGGSTAHAVSADGSVIVGGSDSGQSYGNNSEAFRWTQVTGMVGLGFLPSDTPISTARGVSADGSVAAGESHITNLNGNNNDWTDGFRWTAGGMTGLGGSFGNDITMFDVSGDGLVVVGRVASLTTEAVKWTAATGTVGLGMLPGYGNSRAAATTPNGSVIVGMNFGGPALEPDQAFRWTQGGGMVGLGIVPGKNGSWALDVSADGAVAVGRSYIIDSNGTSNDGAFIWDAADGMRDLRALLVSDYGLASALTGWTLKSAHGVSANGRVIAGYGINPIGVQEAWIADLTPTDPGSPTVDAGANQTIVVNVAAALDGTVIDNNGGSAPTVQWSKVSGPGTVSFGNAAAIDTTANFSTSGTYELKLAATDGALTGADYVYVTVNPLSVALVADADTYISNASKAASKNFGTATGLIVDGNPDISALLKWNLTSIPVGSTVQSVSLSVNATGASSDTYEIYELKRAWTESQATWVKAGATNWQTAGAQGATDRGSVVLGTMSAPTAGAWTIVLNAAGVAVVQGWVDGSANNGFILQDYANPTSDDLVLSSREAATAANRPQLIINYVPAAAALSVVVAAGGSGTSSDLRIAANTSEGASASNPAPTQLGVLLSVAAEPRKSPGRAVASLVPADSPSSAAADRAMANWERYDQLTQHTGDHLLDDDLLEGLLATRREQAHRRGVLTR